MSRKRLPAVWVRKSSDEQGFDGQIANVRKQLDARGVAVPETNWFVATESRRTVQLNKEFRRLMDGVVADAIDVIYVERANRFGTTETGQLFKLISQLRDHDTKLIDLNTGKDLTEDDIASDVTSIVGAYSNREHLDSTAHFSLRSRVSHFCETASWPCGAQPFGYAKLCKSPNGRCKWLFEPSSRTLGQTFHYDDNGKEAPGPTCQKMDRKDRTDVIQLVPVRDAKKVEAVRLAFQWFAREGLSRRQIAIRLNDQGYRYYDRDFTVSIVGELLKNPAYVGEVHFGKRRSGVYRSVEADGSIKKLSGRTKGNVRKPRPVVRPVDDRLIRKKVHEPLIDQKTWKLAQDRIDREQESTTVHSVRNPNYYLSGILFCGHCGSKMVGRTDTHPTTKAKTVFYVCSTYQNRRVHGQSCECGYHRIDHEQAEALLMERLQEGGVSLKQLGEVSETAKLEERLKAISVPADPKHEVSTLIDQSIDAFVEYAGGDFLGMSKDERRAAALFYEIGDDAEGVDPNEIKKLGRAIVAAEKRAAEAAAEEVRRLRSEHDKLTLSWAAATDMQRDVLQGRCVEIERQIGELTPRTETVTERIFAAWQQIDEGDEKRRRLLAEIGPTKLRERGEQLKGAFRRVELFWDREWRGAEEKPSRERRTDRPGRYSYSLKIDAIRYVSDHPDLAGDS